MVSKVAVVSHFFTVVILIPPLPPMAAYFPALSNVTVLMDSSFSSLNVATTFCFLKSQKRTVPESYPAAIVYPLLETSIAVTLSCASASYLSCDDESTEDKFTRNRTRNQIKSNQIKSKTNKNERKNKQEKAKLRIFYWSGRSKLFALLF